MYCRATVAVISAPDSHYRIEYGLRLGGCGFEHETPNRKPRSASNTLSVFGHYLRCQRLLLSRGDDCHIGTTPAHYVGYLIAAIGVAGLLGLNIWWGGLLDKRRDADPAGKIPRAGLIVMAIAVVAGPSRLFFSLSPLKGRTT